MSEIYKNLNINDLENEIWKVIEDCPDYEVSNFGRIKSFKYNKINGNILKPYKKQKYLCLRLYNKNKKLNKKIHHLVYETFKEKLGKGYDVHHINENKEDNFINNLKKMPKIEHSIYHNPKGENHVLFGKHPSEKTRKKMSENSVQNGESNNNSKLEEWQVKTIYQISNSPIIKQLKITQTEIANIFGVCRQTISLIKLGKIWCHIKLDGE